MRVILVLVLIELKTMMRARATLFWIFLFPLVFLSMMMLAYGGKGSLASVQVEIIDEDRSVESTRYGQLLRSSFMDIEGLDASVKLVGAEDGDGAERANEANDKLVRVVIPSGFQKAVRRGSETQVELKASPGAIGPQVAARIIRSATLKYNAGTANAPLPVLLNEQSDAPQAPAFNFAQYLLTGVLVMSTMASAMANVCVVIAERRERNAFKFVSCIPVRPGQYLFAILVARVIVLFFAAAVLIALGTAVFKVPLDLGAPRLWRAAVVVVLGACTLLAMGIAISSRLGTIADGVFVSNVAYIVLLFLSDLTMPISAMPAAFREVVQYLPTSEFATALRHVLISGESLHAQAGRLAVLAAWGLLFALAARFFFRWHRQ